ncbi:MAG: DinB family protein [Bacteroidia bacterium]
MYRHINDFLTDWQYETEGTAKVIKGIPDDLSTKIINPDVRSLALLAWHLTQTLTEMGHRAGLFASDPLAQHPIPESMTEMAALYENYASQVATAVNSKWTDSVLSEMVDMYGDQWSKGTVLRVLVCHQSHHRGQMTVIMRILGLSVPGLYGPSKEEWADMGMDAPA